MSLSSLSLTDTIRSHQKMAAEAIRLQTPAYRWWFWLYHLIRWTLCNWIFACRLTHADFHSRRWVVDGRLKLVLFFAQGWSFCSWTMCAIIYSLAYRNQTRYFSAAWSAPDLSATSLWLRNIRIVVVFAFDVLTGLQYYIPPFPEHIRSLDAGNAIVCLLFLRISGLDLSHLAFGHNLGKYKYWCPIGLS